MNLRITAAASALLMISPYVARADEPVNPDAENDRKVYTTILQVVDRPEYREGLPAYSIGIFCENADLAKLGETKFQADLPSLQADVKTAVDAALKDAKVSYYNSIINQLPMLTRLASAAELEGTVNGILAAFTAYPRTKAEFCYNSAKAMLPEGAALPPPPQEAPPAGPAPGNTN